MNLHPNKKNKKIFSKDLYLQHESLPSVFPAGWVAANQPQNVK